MSERNESQIMRIGIIALAVMLLVMVALLSMALRGAGLIYAADLSIAADIAAGRLVAVVPKVTRRTPGFFLYFPKRMQSQTKLRAFIDTAVRLRETRSQA